MQLQNEGPAGNLEEFGRKMWALMRLLYVTDPSDADKITWSVEGLANESLMNVMRHYNQNCHVSLVTRHLYLSKANVGNYM